MNNLIATYRIQFHKQFNFEALRHTLQYLQRLGIGTLYASPIFDAVPGSNHGYDGLDPHRINPEIGTEEQLIEINQKLKEWDIKWLQDIVPNHMAFDHRNAWLMDVLEKGPQSHYARFFDIVWTSPLFHGRVMVPFLGNALEEVIRNGELKIGFDEGRFVFQYYDARYPLQPLSYRDILLQNEETAPDAIKQLLMQFPKSGDENIYGEQWDEIRTQLSGLQKNEIGHRYIEECLQKVNNEKELLQKIEEQQSYRLCHWQETDTRINYRRFFTVNGLICLNMQDREVFLSYHRFIKKAIDRGFFHGLRVDHIDGLYDPAEYLNWLRELAGEDVPVVVEKILEPGESLAAGWPVQGNTGYDFLSLVNNLFTHRDAEPPFTKFYRQLTKDKRSIHDQLHEKKSYILHNHMAGELENLYQLFRELNLAEKKAFASIRPDEVKEAIGEFLIHCPVYRYYGNQFPLEGEEAAALGTILDRVRRSNSHLRRAVDILDNVLLKKPSDGNEEVNKKTAHFYQRCMQFTGPLMAKGVEDTLMYTYQRFIGHNEVGDAPDAFGMSIDEFHQAMIERQKKWPLSLNATSTHDTKRGEDVRARLNVLTDLHDEWLARVKLWQKMNGGIKKEAGPDANDEYFIYQTMAGAFPMPGQDEENFSERLHEYLQKALREAKTHSNWTAPNEAYESATTSFAENLLDRSAPFRKSFDEFHEKIIDHGIVNSLAQVLLKFTCPGIPDVYQGCELWDLSLVDPDNRRPIDYERRNAWLEEVQQQPDLEKLWQDRYSGKIKLWLVHNLFQFRRQQPELFANGEYIPLRTEGRYKDHVLAFARRSRHSVIVVAVPLHTALICKGQGRDINEIDWMDTIVQFPEGAAPEWQHIMLDATDTHKKNFSVAHLFKRLPFAILKAQRLVNERGAGLLAHISSLPSPFGIGDMGPEAKLFADFLGRSRQRFWQLLPLNPTEEGQGHSPYSSISSRAGNHLFISPDALMRDGLLDAEDLQNAMLPQEGKTNYGEAEKIKAILFEKAWKSFQSGKGTHLTKDFEAFKQKEKEWLDDFSLYALLKQSNGGKPWYEWEDALKFRDASALEDKRNDKGGDIDKIKWLQFIFSRQWMSLKNYCNNRGIQLIGDMPFYVSYDSADVWSHRHLFALDENGERTGMAGVPPDAFSADGQLWGMPVFNWDAVGQENYKWWVERLRKNMELFDIVRLDHFRAFSGYWEVPKGESTAKNGSWKKGPGADFFKVMQKELGRLPFIAEDLGEIDDDVYGLRDEFHFPGMKVLQFAFGEDMPSSVHIPHNYEENFVVYTGTHDNNTTRGWFTTEAGDDAKVALEAYAGRPISSAEVNMVLARMAYASVAAIAILPVQDVLNLDERARMNTPASGSNNWGWRLFPGQINGVAEENLRQWARLYNRE